MVTINNVNMFSIVMVSYRNPVWWKQAVQSVLAQDYAAMELIFCDDDSPGFSSDVVNQFIKTHKGENLLRYTVVANRENRGTVHNMRAAHALCTGRYLLHMAADDALYDAKVLSTFAHLLEQSLPNVLGVYARSVICTAELFPTGACSFDTKRAAILNTCTPLMLWRELCKRCCIHMGATAFLRERFIAFGDFDPNYRLLEDWPFFLMATDAGYSFHFEDFPALRYRRGGVSDGKDFSEGRRLCFEDQLRLYETHILPHLTRLKLPDQLAVYMRYRDDRQDVWEHYGMETQTPLGKVLRQSSSFPLMEALWRVKRWRHVWLLWLIGMAATGIYTRRVL